MARCGAGSSGAMLIHLALACLIMAASPLPSLAAVSEWRIRFMPGDGASINRDVSEMIGQRYIPVGISYDARQMYVLYAKDPDRSLQEWTLQTYGTESAMCAEFASRLAAGWFPSGFTMMDGKYCVLYLKGNLRASEVRFVTCELSNDAIKRTIDAGQGDGFFPVGIDSIGNRLCIIMARFPGNPTGEWKLEAFRLDASNASEVMNSNLGEGRTPFDLLVAGQLVNVFFLKVGGDEAPAPAQTRGDRPARAESSGDHSAGGPAETTPREIFKNTNLAAVQSGPRSPTVFSIDRPHVITYIMNYHYFNHGALPGTIALKHRDGTVYGPWRATGRTGQGGVLNAVWEVSPDVEIKSGTYTIIDSDPGTWSQNAESGRRGHSLVRGYAAAATQPADAPPPAASPSPPEMPVLPQAQAATEPAPPVPTAEARSPRTGTLSTAASVTLANQNAAAGEAIRIEVRRPGHALDGFRLEAPAGSYREARNYRVSCAQITATTFAEVRPVSPLITVENGGGYSRELMRVRIPVSIAADEFAMAFLYDAAAGRIEGLPLVAADSSSITVATRHFSSIFASAVKLARLDAAIMTGELDSGFRPRIDDWPFPNYGSFIEPGGHCAGQSVSALWYYVTRPDGPGAMLNPRYDRNGSKPATPRLWEDDNLGYRLASVIQHSIDWNSWQNKLMTASAGVNDAMTMRAFAYSMMVTREPQEVGVFSDSGGHDMIAYRIKDNALYIADPNFPGNPGRRIVYDAARGSFRPYNSAANAREIAAGLGTSYDTVQYAAKTATIDWGIIETQWRGMRAGTVGNGVFPAYRFAWLDADGNERALTDSMVIGHRRITIVPKLAGDAVGGITVYKGTTRHSFGQVELQPGRNEFGLLVWGQRDTSWAYVDFTPFTIFCSPLTIAPPRQEALVNQECAFTAVLTGAPAEARYEWSVGGERRQNNSSATFKFRSATPGTFDIGLEVFDGAGNAIGRNGAAAVIRAPATQPAPPPATGRLATLQGFRSMKFNIRGGEHTYRSDWDGRVTMDERENEWELVDMSMEAGVPITWSGTSFRGGGSLTARAGSTRYTTEVQGTVSPDGNTLLNLTYTVSWKQDLDPNSPSFSQMARDYSVTVSNIPLSGWFARQTLAKMTATEAASRVRIHHETEKRYDWRENRVYKTDTYVSSDWSDGCTIILNLR